MEILCYLDADFISNFIHTDTLKESFDPNMVDGLSEKLQKLLNYQSKLEAKFTELTTVEDSLDN